MRSAPLAKIRLLLALTAMFAAAGLGGQVLPLGSEFLVNTYTTNAQLFPAVAAAGNDTFVVVWDSFVQDSGGLGVYGQRFDGSGAPLGSEFQINTYTTDAQAAPRVAAAADGSFAVVWQSSYQDGSGIGVFGQRFNAAGAKVGAEFRVNTITGGDQQAAAIAMRPSGEFVVVWSGGYSAYSDETAQRFDATGAKVGAPFLVNTYTTGNQRAPAVAIDPTGDFVVVWGSDAQDGDSFGVFGQRFNAAGQKVGPAFQVNTYTTGEQDYPAIAMDRAGNFVVVWTSLNGQDGSSTGVFGQRFNSDAEKVGPEFPVNTFTASEQGDASIALEPDGGFLVAWKSFGQDGSDFGVFGQSFDRTGARRGSEFQINEYTTDFQAEVRVAETESGPVAVWTSKGPDGDSYGIVGRRQRIHPEALTVDVHGIGITDRNGVFEPGEAVVVEPVWSNRETLAIDLNGSVSSTGFSGPAGPTYTLLDATAAYGAMPAGTIASCYDASSNACYAVQVSNARPSTHWDVTLEEDLDIAGSHIWTMHVGDSFSDVPRSQPFYKKIETLLHSGITTGCNATQYCPATGVSRDQMAIFIAKGIVGQGALVPAAGSVGASAYDCSPGGHSLFTDVAPTDTFCRHVHLLAARNVTLGCNATQYCPGQTITRDAMASFIAKAVLAPGGGGAVPLTYSDPISGRSYSCSSGAPHLHFTDVPTANAFCKHIHYLWARSIVDGCTPTTYCPSAPVARDAMAKFIANGFGLQLYGP